MKPTLQDYLDNLKGCTYQESLEVIHMWVRRGKIDAQTMQDLCISCYLKIQAIEEQQSLERWRKVGAQVSPYSDAIDKALSELAPVPDRTHEECCDCAKETVEPPQCKGHVAGPSPCGDFKRTER